jgi:hypothetical protein
MSLDPRRDLPISPCPWSNGVTPLFTTTDAYQVLLSWVCARYGTKQLLLTNTGAINSLKYRVKGVVAVGSTRILDVGSPAWTDITLGPGDSQPLVLELSWGKVTIEVKSAVVGASTTCELEYNGS